MTKAPLLLILAAVAGCVAAPPLPDRLPNYFSSHGNRVIADPEIPGQFEVIGIAGYDPNQYWCAAGEYTVNRLQQYNARLYVVRPPQPGVRSVVFTLRPTPEVLAAAEAGKGDNLSLMIEAAGDNYSAAGAESTCDQVLPPIPLFLDI